MTGVVVRTVGGGVPSLLHPPSVSEPVLNHMRALASLLTPATPSPALAFHSQVSVQAPQVIKQDHVGINSSRKLQDA